MEITHLFLDMDGILTDFAAAACRVHGILNPYPLAKHPHSYATWDHVGISAADFWKPLCSVGFWETLPRLKCADEYISSVKNSGRPWSILTKPYAADWENCVIGKRRWLMRNYSSLIADRMIAYGDKHDLAGRGRLLIDDCDDNCTAWGEAGGCTVSPDRPWNSSPLSDAACIEQLKGLLA